MTAPRRIRTTDSEAQTARCHRCRSAVAVIEGDGPAVCLTCVYSLGRTAARPESATDAMLAGLLSRHGDVLDLVGHKSDMRWEWKP